MNNTMQGIMVLQVSSFQEVTSEQVLSSQALLSLSVTCLFAPINCWLIAFENGD
jgi:hypothetical protein